MNDRNDKEAIRQDLGRLRDLINSDDLDEDSRRSLEQLVVETEERLAEIEGSGA